MRRQTKLKSRLWAFSCCSGRSYLLTAMLFVWAFCLVYPADCSWSADADAPTDVVPDETVAGADDQNRLNEGLDLAAAQIGRRMYQLAQQTVDQCSAMDATLSESQRKRLAKYEKQVGIGIDAQQQVRAAMVKTDELNRAGRLKEALEQLQIAYAGRKHLPDATIKKIEGNIKVVKVGLEKEKLSVGKLFKDSVKAYKKGQLDQAEAGFQELVNKGVKLSWTQRGVNFTTPAGYLKKIAARRAQLAAAVEKARRATGAEPADSAAVAPEPDHTETPSVQEQPETIEVAATAEVVTTQEVVDARQQADAAMRKADEYYRAGRIKETKEQLEIAYSHRKHLPEPTLKKITDNLDAVDERLAQTKKAMKALFKENVRQYKQDRLDRAEAGFQEIIDSGVKLSWFNRGGDVTTSAGYLKKIAARRAKLGLDAQKTEKAADEAKVEPAEPAPLPPEVVDARQKASAARRQADEHYRAGRLEEAKEQLEIAYALRKHLSDDTVKMIGGNLTAVDDSLAEARQAIKHLFKESVRYYRQDRLDRAEAGFKKIIDGDVKLSLIERGGNVTTSAGYLEKITARRADLAVAEEADQARQAALDQQAKEAEAAATRKAAEEADQARQAALDQQAKEAQAAAERKAVEEAKQARLAALQQQAREARAAAERKAAEEAEQTRRTAPEQQAREAQTPAAATYSLQERLLAQPEVKPTILERWREQERLQIQYIEAVFTNTQERISQLLSQGRFDEATAEVNQIWASIESAKQLLGAERYDRMQKQANAWLSQIREQKKLREQESREQQIRSAQSAELARQLKHEAARQEKIDELFQQALAFRADREYALAVTTLDRLLQLNDKHEQAQLIKEDMEDMLLMVRQAEITRRAGREEKKILDEALESATPWSDIVTYSEDWVEMTERRRQKEEAASAKRRQTEEKLAKSTIGSIDYEELELDQVIDDLQDRSGLIIIPNWPALENVGVSREYSLVTIKGLADVPIGTALDYILENISGAELGAIEYKVDNEGIITIKPKPAGEAYDHETEAYYIADLIEERSDPENSDLIGGQGGGGLGGGGGGGGSSFGGGGMGGGGMGGGGGSSFGGGGGGSSFGGGGGGSSFGGGGGSSFGGGGGGGGGDNYGTYFYDNAMWLVELIQRTIFPETWQATTTTGEGKGEIYVFGGDHLVVYNIPAVHSRIERLLKKLRITRGNQVSIESRLLLINSNFLEDIGLDIDFFLNLSNAGFNQTGAIDPVTGGKVLEPSGTGGNKFTPIIVDQSSSSFTTPGKSIVPSTLGGGVAPTAFQLAGSFLDNIQVDFLMRATQAHQRSRSLTAPHVTVLNGEDAFIQFGTQFAYVAQLQAVVDRAVGIYNPIPAYANSGVSIMVTPTISNDKRYVGLNIEIMQETVVDIVKFEFNTGGGAVGGEQGGPGGSSGTIQQPTIERNLIVTHVLVPDGGTLLLGGQKLVGEVEKEMGVPGLSKIPLVNRLFSNRSKVMDESVLLILIKPKIILQTEEEDSRFGGLTSPTTFSP